MTAAPAVPQDNYEPPRARGWYRSREIAITPWLFLAPGILFFAVYVIAPIFQSFQLSFYEWDGLGAKAYVGTANYAELIGDRNFEISLWNNLRWLVLYLLAIPAGLGIALFLNQTVAGIRLYKSLFFFPFVISQVVVGLVFSWFYLPQQGLLNALLGWFGAGPVNVLGDPTLATYGIIAAGLWPQTAYCMILYLTGLNAVDPEQVEAARLDGAKGWRMLWYVILPQLRPATFIAFVVTDHRRAPVLRPDLHHDQWRPLRSDPRPVVLHVREGALRVRLPHGLRRRHRGGPVPHHAGLHRLLPLAHVARGEGRAVTRLPAAIAAAIAIAAASCATASTPCDPLPGEPDIGAGPAEASFLAGEFEAFAGLFTTEAGPVGAQMRATFPGGFTHCETLLVQVSSDRLAEKISVFHSASGFVGLYVAMATIDGTRRPIKFTVNADVTFLLEAIR